MNHVIHNFEVEVRGDMFYSKEVRIVQIKAYQPVTFIQTDKPIYLPGQTGKGSHYQRKGLVHECRCLFCIQCVILLSVHFRVVTLDTKLRPTNGLVSVLIKKEIIQKHCTIR